VVALPRTRRSTWLTLVACLAAGTALAQSGPELFAEGNALVRSGVYRTALLRYREAAAAGVDTPLLHYNLGIVHYKLGNYAEAADEFARAASEPKLAALAQYNRGLVLRAAGDAAGAAAAFAAAEDLADKRALRKLAQAASQSLTRRVAAESQRPTAARRTPIEARERRAAELRLTAAARLGQDDNVYRAPSRSYVDLSDPAQPLVTPVTRSGSFMPLDVVAAYVIGNEAGDTDFQFRYELDGDFYAKEVSNATRVSQRFSIGADIVLGENERRRREVESAFFVRTHSESNFDPDTGVDREINGADVSDRFSYRAAGVEGDFSHRLGRWRWGFDMRFERREYQRVLPLANYDHDLFYLSADVDYELRPATTLQFGLRRYRRVYDDRPARDMTGALLTTNPAEEYDYQGLQLGVRRKLGSSVVLDADYLRLYRDDKFVGYYDYTQDVLRLRATFRAGSRFTISVAGLSRTYDYPNAFAFNVPAGGPRELDELDAQLHAEYRLTRRLAVWADLNTTDLTSTDARAEYARTQALLGVEWRR
jgi:tetratricopeptide (TPR) repeat protein